MQLSRILFGLAWLLLPVALSGTAWLYLYPLFQGCGFPQPTQTSLPLVSSRAPFRLLALGDPQLEGDSSLPDPDAAAFPSLANVTRDLRNANFQLDEVRAVLLQAGAGALRDAAAWLEGYRKAVDLWGNDYYLAHQVRSLRWWTQPTHVSVLGDLLGSQWVSDGEFEKRAGRYWGVVMRGLGKVPDEITGVEVESDFYDEPEHRRSWGGTTEVLGEDKAWEGRVINIAGNHDIGYAGDIDEARVVRFERAFGAVNWEIWFTLGNETSHSPSSSSSSSSSASSEDDDAATSAGQAHPPPPALRLAILNTMNLDTPAYTASLQTQTYAFMNHLISTSRPVTDKTHATILLTHIPLHKRAGVCVDSPFFDFFEGGSGVREQNMLSEYGSKTVLEGIFGLSGDKRAEGEGWGRRGIVVNGHDHEGCDVLHWVGREGAPGCDGEAVEERQSAEALQMQMQMQTQTALDAHVLSSSALNETGPTDDETPPEEHASSSSSSSPDTAADTDTDTAAADTGPQWHATRFPPTSPSHSSPSAGGGGCTPIPTSSPSLREITLRSMMGSFGGHAGLLSAWFEPSRGERGEWVVEFASCALGVQHWWWGVHAVDFALLVFLAGALVARVVEGGREESCARERGRGGGGGGKEKWVVSEETKLNPPPPR
ncbi:hypothetical protein B5807_02406 [Epicoccum nigrum]|uniref:Calcineurin-like phosphoesterase domain-containing protein n=1 Tax=Epicoccum nigrum TaxID=105696 RepID=A0A1Y2M9G0_EPING|nr:hypothetical protein B5807_02406 [Epicoccum nigrum]